MLINNAIHLSQTGFQLCSKHNKRPNDLVCLESQFSKKYKSSQVSCMPLRGETTKSNNSRKNQLIGWLNFVFQQWVDVEKTPIKIGACPS